MRTLKRTVGRMTIMFGGAIRRRRVVTESKERSCGGGSLGALLQHCGDSGGDCKRRKIKIYNYFPVVIHRSAHNAKTMRDVVRFSAHSGRCR
jgi:hypothetical protein